MVFGAGTVDTDQVVRLVPGIVTGHRFVLLAVHPRPLTGPGRSGTAPGSLRCPGRSPCWMLVVGPDGTPMDHQLEFGVDTFGDVTRDDDGRPLTRRRSSVTWSRRGSWPTRWAST